MVASILREYRKRSGTDEGREEQETPHGILRIESEAKTLE